MPDLPDWKVNLGWIHELIFTDDTFNPGQTVDLQCSQYASLVIASSSGFGASAVYSLMIDMHNTTSIGGLGDTRPWSEFLTSVDGNNAVAEWAVPVMGARAHIVNNGADVVSIDVFGSNRQVDGIKVLGEQATVRRMLESAAILAGVATVIPAGDGGHDSTCFNGPVLVVDTSGMPAGTIAMRYADEGGNTRSITVMTTNGGPQAVSWFHPKGRCTWLYTPNANVGVANRIMTVIPGQQ